MNGRKAEQCYWMERCSTLTRPKERIQRRIRLGGKLGAPADGGEAPRNKGEQRLMTGNMTTTTVWVLKFTFLIQRTSVKGVFLARQDRACFLIYCQLSKVHIKSAARVKDRPS